MYTVEISPLSVKTCFTYDGDAGGASDADSIPQITELFMDDGSYWVPVGGGSYGFTDEANTKAFDYIGFGKVLDADSITSIKFSCIINPEESVISTTPEESVASITAEENIVSLIELN